MQTRVGGRCGLALALGVALLATGSVPAAQVVNPHAGERIGTVQQVYDGALLPDIQVNTFRNIDRLFPTHAVRRGNRVHPLPAGDRPLRNVPFTSDGKSYDLHDYVSLVNPRERVVIVVWSALPKPTGRATVRDNDFFAAVSQALRQDGNGGRGAER